MVRIIEKKSHVNRLTNYIFVNVKVEVNDFIVVDTNISDYLPLPLILDFSI